MSAGAFAVGAVCLLAVAGSLALAARVFRARAAPGLVGAPAALADVVLALSGLVVVAELLGAVGAFARLPVVIACLVLCGAAWLSLRRRPPRDATVATPAVPPPPGAAVVAALSGAVVVFAQWGAGVRAALEQGMILPDTLWYHLPFAARFAQDGWLTRLHYAETEPVTAFYPANAELFHAVGMVLFGRDVLSPYLNLAFVALALLAGWCAGRARGAGPLGLVGAALALSVPIVWGLHAGQAGNDAVGTAFLLAAVALFACAGGRGLLPVAGLAAGLAIGTKLSLVAPVLALTLAVFLLAERGARVRGALAWSAPLLVTGAFWYLRNLFRTGSPLPWVSFDLGPLGFEAPSRMLTEGLEFSVAHYAGRPGVWRQFFLPDLEWALGLAWPALLLLGAAGVLGSILSRIGWQRALALVAAASAVAYLLTPNGAAGLDGAPWAFGLNLRYAVPALAMALVLVSLAPVLSTPRRRGLALGVMLAVLVVNLFSPSGLWSDRRVEALIIGAAMAAAGGAGLLLARARPPRAALAAAAVAAAVALALGGFALQRDYVRDRYAAVGPNVPRASVWAQSVRDVRIGVLGFTPQYPLYGRDLSNRVELIGRPGPRGAFARLETCRGWRVAVNAGRYRYLVVAPVQSPNLPPVPPKREAREAAWTRGDPAASELGRERKVSVFRLDGPLAPGGCPKP